MACLDIIFVVEFSTRLLTTSTLLKKRTRSTVSLGYALKMWTRNPMCYVSSDIGGKSHTQTQSWLIMVIRVGNYKVDKLYLSVSRKESRKVRTGTGDNEHNFLLLFDKSLLRKHNDERCLVNKKCHLV